MNTLCGGEGREEGRGRKGEGRKGGRGGGRERERVGGREEGREKGREGEGGRTYREKGAAVSTLLGESYCRSLHGPDWAIQ